VISRILRVTSGTDSVSMVMAAPRRSRLATTLLPLLAAGGLAAGAVATTPGLQEQAAVGSATAMAVLLAAFGYVYRSAGRARKELGIALARLARAQDDRMRLLAGTAESAHAERRRVATELHDGPIQRLTATAFTLDLLTNALGRGEPDAANELALRIRDQLATEMTSLRRLMTELRPPVLDEGGNHPCDRREAEPRHRT
jgi:signal transduction histidine kinase